MHRKTAIIIPAYNAGRYIEESLGSILAQTEADFDVYVVDDGSADDTAVKVASVASRDSRVRLVGKENGGPASARNAGLEAARGAADFIMFADADDLLAPDALERLVRRAEETGAGIVLSGFTIVNPDGFGSDYSEPDALITPDTAGASLADLYKANLLNQVWAKLFSAELIYSNNIRFQDYRWGEDRLFVFDCLEKAEKVAVLDFTGYRYIMHPGESLISGFYDKKATVCALADIRAGELCEKFGIEDDSCFRYMFAKSIFSCMTNLFSRSCTLSRAEKRDYVRYIIKNPYIIERCSKASGGAAIRAVTSVMATGNVTLNMMTARLAAFAGDALPGLFQKIKHRK